MKGFTRISWLWSFSMLTVLIACGNDAASAESYVENCSIAARDLPAARASFIASRTPGCEAGCPGDEDILALLVAATPGCSSIRIVTDPEEANGVPRVPTTGMRTVTNADTNNEATTLSTVQPPVALYCESSGSMYSYLNGSDPSELKDQLREVLEALRSPLAPVAGQLTTGYIQQRAESFSGGPMAFVKSLSPENLKGTASGSSDISQLIELTLDQAGDGVAVLLSDFVFSPGKGKPAEDYLDEQRLALQRLMETRLADDDRFAVALVAADATDFKGFYYDHNDKPTLYSGSRPYYYFVGGRNPGVRAVAEAIEKATGGKAITFAKGGARIDYTIPMADKSLGLGTYRVSGTPGAMVVSNPEAARGGGNRGLLRIPVAVDLGTLPLTQTQLSDVNIIRTTDEWSVTSVRNIDPPQPPYTHVLSLDYSGDPYPGDIAVSFPVGATGSLEKRYLPEGTSDEGDPSGFDGKTYGLRDLVQGIDAAYAKTTPPGTPAGNFTFKIEK